MNRYDYTDLNNKFNQAKSVTTLQDCEALLDYFKGFSKEVLSKGSQVPQKYLDIQVELTSKILNHRNDNTNEDWYKKPKGIIFMGVTVGVIVLTIRQIFFTP